MFLAILQLVADDFWRRGSFLSLWTSKCSKANLFVIIIFQVFLHFFLFLAFNCYSTSVFCI